MPIDTTQSLNRIVKREKKFRRSFTSSTSGTLAIALRESQSVLLMLLGVAANKPVDPDKPEKRAVLALSVAAFRFARCAYLLIASRYPIQALASVRAMYERLACAIRVRRDPALANKWRELSVKISELPKYATELRNGFPELLDEFVELRGGDGISQELTNMLKREMARMYGPLCDYSHPAKDMVRCQFFVDDSDQQDMFFFGPDLVATPFEPVGLVLLAGLQLMLGCLLLVEFGQGEHWKPGVSAWDYVASRLAKEMVARSDSMRSEFPGLWPQEMEDQT